ncbi:DNA replication terminus site binding protein [uncultured Thiomicrorhabdus sp.]
MSQQFNNNDISPERIQSELHSLLGELSDFRNLMLSLCAEQIWLPETWQSKTKEKVRQTAEHLTQIYFQPDQDGKETTLLPGIILADEDFIRKVECINASKLLFKQRMQFAKKTLGRSPYLSLVKQVIHPHSISLLQLYRDFRCLYEPVIEVKFSWVFKETANVKLSVQGAIKHIEEQIENLKIQQDLIHKVASLGDVEFLYQRQIAPHLQANIKFEADKPIAKKIHSPLFLMQETMPQLPQQEIPLQPTAQVKTRAPRKDKKQWQRLYEGLNLYYA